MAARARTGPQLLPGQPGPRQHGGGRWRAGGCAPAARRCRSLYLRSARPSAHARRRGVLQPARFPVGSDGPAPGGTAPRRAGLLDASARTRSRSGGTGESRALRFDQPARHGFHRQTRRRVPRWLRAQPDRRHSAAALPQLAGAARGGAARRRVRNHTRRRHRQQRVSQGPSHPGGDFEQQLPALRPQSQHRRRHRRRNPPGEGQPDHLPRPPASLAAGADGDVL